MKIIFITTFILANNVFADERQVLLQQLKEKITMETQKLQSPAKEYPKSRLKRVDQDFYLADQKLENLKEVVRQLPSRQNFIEERVPGASQFVANKRSLSNQSNSGFGAGFTSNTNNLNRGSLLGQSGYSKLLKSAKVSSQQGSTPKAKKKLSSLSSSGIISNQLLDAGGLVSAEDSGSGLSFGTDSSNSGSSEDPVNNAPEASDDELQVAKNGQLDISIEADLLNNDSDSDGDDISFVQFENLAGQYGDLVEIQAGTYRYQPAQDATGEEIFSYQISDGTSTASGSLKITIRSVPVRKGVLTGVNNDADSVGTDFSFNMDAQALYVAFVSFRDAGNLVLSVDGLGLNWIQLASQCSNSERVGLEVWYAFGAASSSTAVTASLNADVDSAQIAVLKYSDVDPSVPIVNLQSANPLGLGANASCGNPATATKDISYQVEVDDEFQMLLSGLSFVRYNGHTAISMDEVLEIDSNDGNANSASGLVVQELTITETGDYQVDGELDSATQWSSISLLIRPQP